MFVGHYGPRFLAKRANHFIPLWVLFLAVQLMDVLWAVFVFLGIESLRIVPGFTKTNALALELPCARPEPLWINCLARPGS